MKRLRGLMAMAIGAALLPSLGAGQAPQEGAFVLLIGDDTLAIENFSRGPATASAEITGRSVGRLAYTAYLAADQSIRQIGLQAWTPGQAPDTPPVQDATLTMGGDTADFVARRPGAEPTRQALPTRPDAIPFLNPSFLLVEQILRHSRELGGDTVQIPLLLLQGGQTISSGVVWHAPDSATLTVGGVAMNVTMTEEGRLVSAAIPSQNLRVERAEGRHLAPITMASPDYSAPEGAPYTAEEVSVATAAGHTLAGTLTRPRTSEPVPAVVLVSGSGSQDRDEALPLLPGFRPFREIADSLGRRGIAVLRLDDRGFGESGGDAASATTADLADDVRAALATLRDRDGIDGSRLAVVGHSEGGMIAPMVAADDADLAAIVVVAGPARTGREIIHYQQRQAIEDVPGLTEAQRDSMAAAARAELEVMAARQPWLGFFLDYDPIPTARQVTDTPVLILHGETDRQVTVDQAGTLAETFRTAGNPDVTLRVFPDINHLLLRDPEGDPSGYSALESREVDREVLGTLVDWLVQRLDARGS